MEDKNKLNILINFVVRENGGGVSTYAFEMAKGLIASNNNVFAIISENMDNIDLWKSLPFKKLLIIKGFSNTMQFLWETLLFKFKQGKLIKNIFSNIIFDAIYIPFILYWTPLINKKIKKKIIISTIHDPKPHSKSKLLINYINYYCIKKSDKIIILSNTFRDYLIKKYKRDNDDIIHIPLGIQTYYDQYERNDYKPSWSYDERKVNFLFYGQISKYKGLDVLISAYKKVFQNSNDVTLTIIGNGDMSSYNNMIKGIQNISIINRWIENYEIPYIFKGKNIVTVCPYKTATQSGIIPLAMYYESLVIATRTGGLVEQIRDNETGLLVNPNDVEDLSEIMKYVASNIEQFNYIILNSKKFINNFTWDQLSSKILEIIIKG